MTNLPAILSRIEELRPTLPYTVDQCGFHFNSAYWSLTNLINTYMSKADMGIIDAEILLEKTITPPVDITSCALNVVIVNGLATTTYWNQRKSNARDRYAELLKPIISDVRNYGTSLDKTIELAYLFQMFHEELQVDSGDKLWIPFETKYENANSNFIEWLFEPYPEFLELIHLDKELMLFNPDEIGFHESLQHVIGLYNRLNLHIQAEPIEFNF